MYGDSRAHNHQTKQMFAARCSRHYQIYVKCQPAMPQNKQLKFLATNERKKKTFDKKVCHKYIWSSSCRLEPAFYVIANNESYPVLNSNSHNLPNHRVEWKLSNVLSNNTKKNGCWEGVRYLKWFIVVWNCKNKCGVNIK